MISFFVLLLIFALALTIIELVSFGSLRDIVTLNQSNDLLTDKPNIDFTIVGFFLFIFIFILIAGLIIKFLQNYHEKNSNHASEKTHRKLIPIDFKGSSEKK